MRTYDPTQPRPFEELVDIVGIEMAGDMLEAAAPAVAETGADVQQTGAILLAAVRGLQDAGHRQLTITRPYEPGSVAASTDRVHLVHERSVVTTCCGKRVLDLSSGERWTARQELVNCAPYAERRQGGGPDA